MSTTNIDYNNFQPDWWDTVGITAETVKASIENSINEAFGSTGVTAIQEPMGSDSNEPRIYDMLLI